MFVRRAILPLLNRVRKRGLIFSNRSPPTKAKILTRCLSALIGVAVNSFAHSGIDIPALISFLDRRPGGPAQGTPTIRVDCVEDGTLLSGATTRCTPIGRHGGMMVCGVSAGLPGIDRRVVVAAGLVAGIAAGHRPEGRADRAVRAVPPAMNSPGLRFRTATQRNRHGGGGREGADVPCVLLVTRDERAHCWAGLVGVCVISMYVI